MRICGHQFCYQQCLCTTCNGDGDDDIASLLCRNKSDASTVGGLAIAVSLELKGLELAHTRHGMLPWVQLVQVHNRASVCKTQL